MKITWYGHACFGLETAQGSVILDPYSDGSVPGFGPLRLQADAVLCSHGHGDHSFAEAVTLSGKSPSFAVEDVASYHDDAQGSKRGANIIRIIEAEGMKAVHLGDLGCALTEAQIEKLRGADVLMIPVGGFYTIDAAAAHQIVAQIEPRVVIPMHYRHGERGLQVIAPLEDYLASSTDVVRYEGASVTVDADTPKQMAVLQA